jgi:hypothetical protein
VIRAEDFQDLPGEPEPLLRRLIGIGGSADDERLTSQPSRIESSREHLGNFGLDQDLLLEGFPGGQAVRRSDGRFAPWSFLSACPPDRLTARPPVRPFHHPSMGIPRIAVGTAELTAHVGVDGPEPHVGGGGSVEHGPYRQLDELGAPGALVQDG